VDNIKRLQQPQVDALVEAGSVRSATVEPAPGEGWTVRIRYGMTEAVVASQHRQTRIWQTLDGIGNWMRDRGIRHWEVHGI